MWARCGCLRPSKARRRMELEFKAGRGCGKRGPGRPASHLAGFPPLLSSAALRCIFHVHRGQWKEGPSL